MGMPLEFRKLVTDGWFLEIVTLGRFRRGRVSSGHAIIFSEACHKQVVPGHCDIKWFSQSEEFQWTCHYIFWRLSQTGGSRIS